MVYRAKYPHTETKVNFYMIFLGGKINFAENNK